MGKFSRNKGKRGERATAAEIREAFPHLDIKRGWQSRAGDDDPDVCGLPGFWIEVKSGVKPNPRAALEQAITAAPPCCYGMCVAGNQHSEDCAGVADIPIAVIRDDRRKSFCVLAWSDMLEILRHHPKLKDRNTSR